MSATHSGSAGRPCEAPARIAAVVIGHNEEPRLSRCLESVLAGADPVVFVDSASEDRSVEVARDMGVEVVTLDDPGPHSAARGRNAGYRRAAEMSTDLDLVQFVDGDSEIAPAWLEAGRRGFVTHPDAGAVCGRMRERRPERSPFHRMRDVSMDRTAGEVRGCGGTMMVRAAAFEAVGGFDESIAAGEDFDFCFRMRRHGWRTARVDSEMASHDAGDLGVRQWWSRSERDGRAYAHIVALHWRDPERLWVREWASVWLWGAALPLAAAGAGLVAGWPAWLAVAAYPALFVRTYRGLRRRGLAAGDARFYAAFCVLGKFPQALGQARFLSQHLMR